MNANEYQKQALLTESNTIDKVFERITTEVDQLRLAHALMGLVTEVGELVDLQKKGLFYGKEINRDHAIKELGDICWYLALAADYFGITLEEIFDINIEKLRKRYGEKFSSESALNRKEGDI